MLRFSHVVAGAVGAGVLCAGAWADQVTATTVKDNTLFEAAPDNPLSSGSGVSMFCGKTSGGTIRRALMKFDVAGVVPAGSTITSVTLRLQCINTPPSSTARTCSLYRLLADWGEGISSSNGGGGDIAGPGDATWYNRFEATASEAAVPWTTPGGQFAAISSASTTVGAAGTSYSWGSTAQMVADVQSWLDSPSTNYGWVLRGNEASSQTARKFATREDLTPAFRPKITINFTPPPACNDIDFNNDTLFPDTQDITDFLDVFGGAACPTGNCDSVDFNNDGLFPDTDDVAAFLRVFAGGQC